MCFALRKIDQMILRQHPNLEQPILGLPNKNQQETQELRNLARRASKEKNNSETQTQTKPSWIDIDEER